MFSLICVWINGWVNNRDAGDYRRYRAHYDVIVMQCDWSWYTATHDVTRRVLWNSSTCLISVVGLKSLSRNLTWWFHHTSCVTTPTTIPSECGLNQGTVCGATKILWLFLYCVLIVPETCGVRFDISIDGCIQKDKRLSLYFLLTFARYCSLGWPCHSSPMLTNWLSTTIYKVKDLQNYFSNMQKFQKPDCKLLKTITSRYPKCFFDIDADVSWWESTRYTII